MPSPDLALKVRPAELNDSHDIFKWRNDEDTRRMFFDQSVISLESHQLWFANSLVNRNKKLIVAESNDQKVGVVRFDYLEPGYALVSINLNPLCRGKGLAAEVLVKSEALLSQGTLQLIAEIKPENASSKKTFARAGYTLEQIKPHAEIYTKTVN